MKAIQITNTGGHEVIRAVELDRPKPAAEQETAGVVVAVGANVERR